MTKADEMNLSNLMENVRKMENATKNNNNEAEIAKIRQYCIDAVRDYNETNKKITDLINANRDLWKNPYIKGSNDGFVDGKPYHLGEHDFWHSHCPFTFNKGKFPLADFMYVCVGNISGNKQRTGYCGHFEDHDIISKDWVAESVCLSDCEQFWSNDLIADTFEVKNTDGTTTRNNHYTEENLKKYNWTIEGWTSMKEKADRTRKRTENLVREFKKALEKRISESTEKLNKLTTSSETSVYIKVQF